MVYAVIDTNIFVSAFITKNATASTRRVINSLFAGKIRWRYWTMENKMTVSANYAMRHPSCPCGPIPHNHFLASLLPAVPSRTKNWRRPLMVRQPYSVAV